MSASCPSITCWYRSAAAADACPTRAIPRRRLRGAERERAVHLAELARDGDEVALEVGVRRRSWVAPPTRRASNTPGVDPTPSLDELIWFFETEPVFEDSASPGLHHGNLRID
jgi:hypothetical protein